MMRRRGLIAGLALAPLLRARAAGAAPQGSITVLGFAGLFAENYRKFVIAPFMRKYPGVSVNYRQVSNSGEGMGLLRVQKEHPSVDVAILDISVAIQGDREALFAPLDPALVPALAEIPDWGRRASNTGAALSVDNLAIIYNTTEVKTPITSWNDLLRPELKGRLAMTIADTRGVVLIPVLDRMAGADYKETIDPAIGFLKRVAPSVQSWEPLPEIYTAVESGLVAAGIGWNGRGQFVHDESKGDVAVAIPREGSVGQTNTINLLAHGGNMPAAQAFIDYALGAEAQAAFAAGSYYGPTNSRVQLDPALRARIFGGPEAAKAQMTLDWAWLADRYGPWIGRIKREVIGG